MKVSVAITALLLFLAQVYLVLCGATWSSKWINPWLLLATGLGLAVLYLYVFCNARLYTFRIKSKWVQIIPFISALIVLIIAGISFVHNFQKMPDPGAFSDVNPQLETLFARFVHGEQPYYPLILPASQPFPVYMPLHWLPVGIARLLSIDTRWIGFIIFAIVVLVYAFTERRNTTGGLSVLLPAIVVLLYITYDGFDMADTLELIVASYYLLLGVGLQHKHTGIITAGIIACLLSRYTLVFWLPMIAIILWQYAPRKLSYLIWGVTTVAVLALYVCPFLLRDPSILIKGVKYHNVAAIADWNGTGASAVSWTHEDGISFGAGLKNILPGDSEKQVTIVRAFQAILMIGYVVAGILLYRKISHRIAIGNYNLAWLYVFVITFYLVSPLTYKYYWISPLMLAAVMTAGIVSKSQIRRISSK